MVSAPEHGVASRYEAIVCFEGLYKASHEIQGHSRVYFEVIDSAPSSTIQGVLTGVVKSLGKQFWHRNDYFFLLIHPMFIQFTGRNNKQ